MDGLKLMFFVATLMAVSIASVRLDDECEAYNSPERSLGIVKSGSNQDQKSLLIAFDGTRSMTTDLNQLRAGAKEITREFANRIDNPIYDYILSIFRDPAIEPTLVTRDPDVLIARLDAIVLNSVGNPDCPELAIQGLKNVLEEARPNSIAFLFSDASAKDYHLYENTVSIIRAKQIKVFFLLTGDCGQRNGPQFKVYEKIARVSDGQVFNMRSTNVRDVLMALSVALNSDFVALKSLDFEEAGASVTTLEVDETFTNVTVTLSGLNARMTIRDSARNIVTSAESFASANINIISFAVTDNIYEIEASATSAYSIRAGGISGVQFRFGFSTRAPTSQVDTQIQPIADRRNILSIFLSDQTLVKCLTRATLVPVMNHFDDIEIQLKRTSNGFFSSNLFNIPSQMFKIKIYGYDSSGNVIDRIISTAVESVAETTTVTAASTTIQTTIKTTPTTIKEESTSTFSTLPSTTYTSTISTTPSTPSPIAPCPVFVCPISGFGKIPHITNCSRYYECIAGMRHPRNCDVLKIFDIVTLECGDPSTSICANNARCGYD